MGDLQDPIQWVGTAMYHLSGHILMIFFLHRPKKIGPAYGMYLKFRFLKWPLIIYPLVN